jgi:hypothetical protein
MLTFFSLLHSRFGNFLRKIECMMRLVGGGGGGSASVPFPSFTIGPRSKRK